jgi:very-short-patch-repair endonuclease
MVLPSAVTDFAQAHFGVVTRALLGEAGVSARRVRRMAAAGELTRLYPKVFSVAGVPRTWEQCQLGACLSTGGVASHRAALRLWLPNVVRDTTSWPVEVTVAAHQAPALQGVVVHRAKDLSAGSISRRGGVPLTNPLRMLADLAAVTEFDELARAVDECVVARLLTIEGVRAALASASKRRVRGVGLLRAVLDEWPVGDTRPDSVLELKFARMCRRAGLPEPAFQYELTVAGATRRVDFAFPELRLAIEVDGFAVRTNREVFQRERRRQNDFTAVGWTILRFTWHDITNEPDYVVRKIMDTLALASRRSG